MFRDTRRFPLFPTSTINKNNMLVFKCITKMHNKGKTKGKYIVFYII